MMFDLGKPHPVSVQSVVGAFEQTARARKLVGPWPEGGDAVRPEYMPDMMQLGFQHMGIDPALWCEQFRESLKKQPT
jgi:hypothetical protein